MPRLTRPPTLPDDVAEVIGVLGSAARLEIIRHLDLTGPTSVAELVERVEATRPAIQKHLTELQRAGVVVPDLPEDRWHGRKVLWRLEPERVGQMAEVLRTYALPVSSGRTELEIGAAGDVPHQPH
ncbi:MULTISPECIES: helix-turn-helix transcriptional regulator [unclassified Cellulomonas]|uniref:ArsR/SmtB family transcription factor n=1 Tax=unclassified Cellulomonas TaxID=2620175 RepID=UPI001C4F3A9D|nr:MULTISPECIES: helix-turn-helix domain-containing protein [unclassified Cellulomonas]MBW0255837.1 helix-turn-helix domain-containing protein [Cellulomonas sp. PS-H5]MCG7288056.1 helix-turn-helix domain-containing protein [Cellulomonas sp. ACRRI]